MPRAGIVSEVSEQSCRNLQVTCCHCAAHSYAGIEDETVGSVAVDCVMRSQHMGAQVVRQLVSAMKFERAYPLLESLIVDLISRQVGPPLFCIQANIQPTAGCALYEPPPLPRPALCAETCFA